MLQKQVNGGMHVSMAVLRHSAVVTQWLLSTSPLSIAIFPLTTSHSSSSVVLNEQISAMIFTLWFSVCQAPVELCSTNAVLDLNSKEVKWLPGEISPHAVGMKFYRADSFQIILREDWKTPTPRYGHTMCTYQVSSTFITTDLQRR